jgi:hypothetical protein
MTIDPRFIIELHGKQYITHEGLLHMAHEAGLTSISTSLISYGGVGKEAVVRATVEGEKGKRLMFTGLGDASPENVGRGIATATLRMAETRAVNRALRAYLGIGMTTYEEMPEGEPAKKLADPLPRAPAPRAPSNGGPLPLCPDCGEDMWDNREARAQDKADRNKKNARPAFKCKKNRDHTPIWESTGWEQKINQAEMDSTDAADRYDDSLDYSTEDPPF